jgi:hypothetical protein
LNALDELKITRQTQHEIQCRFNSIHDRHARIIGCCCCGISCILPTVSEEGNILPPLELKQFPSHTLFGPVKFTEEELAERNLQSESKQMVRSTNLAHDGQQYHFHQELITERQVGEDDDSTLIMEGYICNKCENDLHQSKIPMYTVVKLDFGLISRVIQDELTPIEKLLIA